MQVNVICAGCLIRELALVQITSWRSSACMCVDILLVTVNCTVYYDYMQAHMSTCQGICHIDNSGLELWWGVTNK